MMKKMRHIGIIVEDFDSTVKKFEGFGLPCNEVIEREEEGMRIAFFPIGAALPIFPPRLPSGSLPIYLTTQTPVADCLDCRCCSQRDHC